MTYSMPKGLQCIIGRFRTGVRHLQTADLQTRRLLWRRQTMWHLITRLLLEVRIWKSSIMNWLFLNPAMESRYHLSAQFSPDFIRKWLGCSKSPRFLKICCSAIKFRNWADSHSDKAKKIVPRNCSVEITLGQIGPTNRTFRVNQQMQRHSS